MKDAGECVNVDENLARWSSRRSCRCRSWKHCLPPPSASLQCYDSGLSPAETRRAWRPTADASSPISTPIYVRQEHATIHVQFLANVNSSSRSLYIIGRPSVCRLSVCLSSVTLVHPTQAIEIFGNVSTPFGILAIHVVVARLSSQLTASCSTFWSARHLKILLVGMHVWFMLVWLFPH